MKAERYIPSEWLRPYVRTFMVMESDTGMQNRLLPDTSVVMAFRYKGDVGYQEKDMRISLPRSVVTGLRKSARLVDYSKTSGAILVIFTEGGAAAFFNTPLHELSGISVSLHQLTNKDKVNETEDHLAHAVHNSQRITIIEQFLFSTLMRPYPDPLITAAMQKIQFANGNIRVSELAASLHISQDPFEKRFRKTVGASPKQFATITRLRHFISAYTPGRKLTDAAYEAGYFDQSHFIKDFRVFTGQTPHDFFRSTAYW